MRTRMLPQRYRQGGWRQAVRTAIRPTMTAWAVGGSETDESTDRSHIAPRDAGWVELLSADGEIKYGRGHLMLWLEPPDQRTDSRMRAELHSFTAEEELREDAPLVVAPENETDRYPVTFHSLDAIEHEHGGLVNLYWDDETLPASLRELGGH